MVARKPRLNYARRHTDKSLHPSRASRSLRSSPVVEKYFKETLAPMTLRLALGLVCVYHGYLKIMASGGTSWNPGLSVGWQLLLAWGEFCAGVAILLGFRTRFAAVAMLVITVGTQVWREGWNVLQLPITSLEPILFLLLIGLSLLFLGAGEMSIDGRGKGRGGMASASFRKR
jgi:uncharacterized membrane protein YphA (DoxX/SURF4 family)